MIHADILVSVLFVSMISKNSHGIYSVPLQRIRSLPGIAKGSYRARCGLIPTPPPILRQKRALQFFDDVDPCPEDSEKEPDREYADGTSIRQLEHCFVN